MNKFEKYDFERMLEFGFQKSDALERISKCKYYVVNRFCAVVVMPENEYFLMNIETDELIKIDFKIANVLLSNILGEI